MSIPDRLWRVARGHWNLASEQFRSVEEKLAEADAYKELADALSKAKGAFQPQRDTATGAVSAGAGAGTQGLPSDPAVTTLSPRDPLDACYALLQVSPGCDLATLERAHQGRLTEINVEGAPEGSPERTNRAARRDVVNAAYERLRDLLNPTETRFEHLEF